ncbi:DinB family protein [Hazenella coriacea]|uniref:Putative damage-inducible protein DinB n=1 Tax=Hazenella coriacea TaxID=1179467 RepID=A0A4R3L0Y0_9BACL|nr:DinB family protein [Hazenella coriacea]TCS93213.1 putative damage-inducible protein DinB [Hazenella coriacea]
MKQHVLQQYDYHVWANKKVCAHLQDISEVVYHKEIKSVFPTIYDAMTHIYEADYNWLTFLSKGGVTDLSATYFEELKKSTDRLVAETKGKRIEELNQMMIELSDSFREYITNHEDIEAMCPYGEFKARYVDYIQHIVNHGTYHRGNVTAMLRQIGHPGTQTDYGFYLLTLSQ